MARQRMIKPDIWVDEGFLSLSIPARLLFIGMISGADDEGRGLATDRCLKARVFASDDMTLEQVRQYRTELQQHVNVVFYEVDGREYYQLTKWGNHQRVDHPIPSTCPPPREDAGIAREDAGTPRANELINESMNKAVSTLHSPPSIPRADPKPRISYNFSESVWYGISDEQVALWAEAYPAVDIELELRQMGEWCKSAGAKGHKQDWRKFIVNWLKRSQDRGGSAPKGEGTWKNKRYSK